MVAQQAVACSVCNQGSLVRKKVYRMSGIVAFIGYILLMPSLLGVLICAIGVVGAVVGGSRVDEARNATDSMAGEMRAKGVPDGIIAKLRNGETVTDGEMAKLTVDQRREVETVQAATTFAKGAGVAGAAIGVGLFIFLGIVCLVSGLIGWLLVMKKWVLQCTNCKAVTASA